MSHTGQNSSPPSPDANVAKPLHGLLDNLIEQFASAIAARAEQMLSRSGALRLAARGGAVMRMCPYPGCKTPGAGPRNRWFCREHSHSVPVREQKRILAERAKENAAAAREARAARTGGRRLDMRCRVEGCKNLSRGPRFGYICDEHRKSLSAKEQREAREKWNAAHPKKAA
jgi:hypothetical protein